MTTIKINFRELMADMINGSSETVEFCIKFAEEHQVKEDMSDGEICEQLLKFVARDSNHQKTREVIELNESAASSIIQLKNIGKWTQLNRIAEHALEQSIECLQREDGKFFVEMLKINKIKLAAFNTSADKFHEIFKPEFLDKF